MGRRSRRREQAGDQPAPLTAPTQSYELPNNGVLVLRCVLTAKTRQTYATLRAKPAATQEDQWHRAVEFLFERLAVRWTVSGVDWEGDKEVLGRFRVATPDERQAVRDILRDHVVEWFPEVQAP